MYISNSICYYYKESPGDGATEKQIKALIGQPTDLVFAKVVEQGFKTLDGRVQDAYLATPGGDAGEFILAL